MSAKTRRYGDALVKCYTSQGVRVGPIRIALCDISCDGRCGATIKKGDLLTSEWNSGYWYFRCRTCRPFWLKDDLA